MRGALTCQVVDPPIAMLIKQLYNRRVVVCQLWQLWQGFLYFCRSTSSLCVILECSGCLQIDSCEAKQRHFRCVILRHLEPILGRNAAAGSTVSDTDCHRLARSLYRIAFPACTVTELYTHTLKCQSRGHFDANIGAVHL